MFVYVYMCVACVRGACCVYSVYMFVRVWYVYCVYMWYVCVVCTMYVCRVMCVVCL